MEVKIERLDDLGRGITTIHQKICFVEDALPNEVVDIKIQKEHSKYLEGTVLQYVEQSPIRIEAECPYTNLCGGCQLNHICYNEENKFKKEKVKRILKKYADLDPEIVDSIIYQNRNYYRNKITLHGNKKTIGLYRKKSSEIIPIKECLLENHKINELIHYFAHLNSGLEEVIIKTSNDNSKVMVSIKGEIEDYKKLLKLCDVLIINNQYMTNEQTIITSIGSKKYYESISSFFQVNNTLTELLYDEIVKEVKDDNYQAVLDLYCGTGTIGIYISELANKIIGIDYNPSNIEDANKNKELNQVKNIEFICDKVENKIESFQNIDLIIVDPPRAGLDGKTRKALTQIYPKKIIYVSCDPITLARDLKELKEHYQIKSVKIFNMFPRTYHVECVCLLMKK